MIEDLRTRYVGKGFEFEEERFWKPATQPGAG
jgi:hypothetical protein